MCAHFQYVRTTSFTKNIITGAQRFHVLLRESDPLTLLISHGGSVRPYVMALKVGETNSRQYWIHMVGIDDSSIQQTHSHSPSQLACSLVASIGLVSPGAVTDGVTLLLPEKLTTF